MESKLHRPADEDATGRRRKKNRGFYVKMRLHGSSSSYNKHQKWFHRSYRCFKYILWISLSLYFLTSFLLRNDVVSSPPSLFKHSSSHLPSRALFESQNVTADLRRKNLDFVRDLKVYVYELPPKYNSEWLGNERCNRHLFAAEVAIHKALLNSDERTLDPYDADFFFVPVYVSCNFSAVNGFPAIGHARSLISSAVDLVSSSYPFWNFSRGADHVFVASHDFGSCFHTLEDVAMADGVPEILRNSVILQTFGVKYEHPCQAVENVVIPPYIPPETVRLTLEKFPIDGRRDIFAFFRGKMELHPKNVSGRFYSKGVRTKIWDHFNRDRRFYLRRHRFAGYQSEIARSAFCLCPLGWAPWSPRLVESVALGCVPVIIADGILLPFSSVIPWPEISITVPENDVARLGEILDDVARTNLSDIQRNLRDPAISRALLFHDPAREGDATWQVMSALAHKLERSRRRVSRVEGQ